MENLINSWKKIKLGEIGPVKMCKRIMKSQTSPLGDIPFYKIGTFGGRPDSYISREVFEDFKSNYPFPKKGDLLISAAGTIGRIVVFDGADSYFQDSNIVWIDNNEKLVFNDFLRFVFQNITWRTTDGGAVSRLYNGSIRETELSLPPLPEQKKIAEILSTWDEAINSNTRLLHFVKQQKGIYVNRIFMGRLFTNIDNKKAFEKLSKHIVEKTDRNKSNNTSDVLSVSNTKGFVLQSDQFEREIASKDKNNYKIVRKGQFAYNPSRINVGSIDQLLDRDIGIISPMYVVFECKETIESRYLYHFLKSEYFLRLIPRFTQGSVRDSLSFDGLSNMKIYIPSIDKQVKYSNLLDTIDEKIKVLERKNEYLSKQKQGLMQRLLTGKVRVKLD